MSQAVHDSGMHNNIDPDLNLEVPEIPCQYYDQNEFLNVFKFNTNTKLLHINARSLSKNITSIVHYLNLLQTSFSVIGVSESWLKDIQDPLIQIPNYTLEGSCRLNKRGGGVVLYIKQDLEYKIRNDLCINDSETESFFIEVINSHKSNVIIGIVYKPPCVSGNNFTDHIDEIFSRLNAENKNCYIMGDYNINLLQCDTDITVQHFMNILDSQSFYPTINKPTRITTDSATLIDNILTNDYLNHTAGVLVADISDHLPVFLIIDNFRESVQANIKPKRRVFDKSSIENFIHDLNEIDWDCIMLLNDVHCIYSNFLAQVEQLYDRHFPVQEFKYRYDKSKSPWMSEGIYNSIRRKNHLYKKFLKNRTSQNKSNYTMYKNKLTCIIKLSKKNYLSKKFNQEKNNIKGTWKVINSLLNTRKNKVNPTYFCAESSKITGNKEIADAFNKYFVNIGSKLTSELPLCNTPIDTFLSERCSNSFFLTPITQEEIVDTLNKLPAGKAPGFDELSSFVIKQAKYSLAKPLADIFNKALTAGVFPDGLKMAQVIPVYKKGSKHDIENYRPISVLSTFSKLFEKLICTRLTSFICKHNILSESQFGFRRNRSTDLATSYVVNKLCNDIDHNHFSIGVFLDLSKAFDTVNHAILIRKLEYYGIRGVALDLFKSYLRDRCQYVLYNSVKSMERYITCGVPQGSVLGPLLFILYINDICNTSSNITFCLFADDTSLIYTDKNVDLAIQNLNIELRKISTWLLANKLCINVLKSKYIIFCASQYSYTQSVPLILNDGTLDQVKDTTFLGVHIDENLTWKKHIDHIIAKISKNIGIMNRLKYFLPSNILLTLYNSFVLPYLNYSILAWGSPTPKCNRLLTLQKRAVRIIFKTGFCEHTGPLFANLKLLKFADLYYFNLGLFMYKYMSRLLPACFNSFFTLTSNVHSYTTRSTTRKHLYVNYTRTSLSKSGVVERGTLFWNSLDDSFRSLPSLSMFAKKLKAHFITGY